MRFRVNKRRTNFESKYPKQDRDLAKKFSKLIYNELGDFDSKFVLRLFTLNRINNYSLQNINSFGSLQWKLRPRK